MAEKKPAKPAAKTPRTFYIATGRRKTAVARVRVTEGKGTVLINGKPLEEYFHEDKDRAAVLGPLKITDQLTRVDVFVNAKGGGVTGQAGAVCHGIARALIAADPELRPVLKAAGLLTRDSREKERKKYGLKRARKAPQYTKR